MENPVQYNFYILQGIDSTIKKYIDKTNNLESIQIYKTSYLRNELAEKINSQFENGSENSAGLLNFCKNKIKLKYILEYISPETKSDEESLFSITDSSSDDDFLPPLDSSTLIYACDDESKILSFAIFTLDKDYNMKLHLICSPYSFGSQTMEKLIQYSKFMNLKNIYLDAILNIVSFYEKYGFKVNTEDYAEEQIKSYKKYKNTIPMILQIGVYSTGGLRVKTRRRKKRRTRNIYVVTHKKQRNQEH